MLAAKHKASGIW